MCSPINGVRPDPSNERSTRHFTSFDDAEDSRPFEVTIAGASCFGKWTTADLEQSAAQLADWLDNYPQHDSPTSKPKRPQQNSDAVYREIERDSEIRVLEILPGTYVDELSATLRHVCRI